MFHILKSIIPSFFILQLFWGIQWRGHQSRVFHWTLARLPRCFIKIIDGKLCLQISYSFANTPGIWCIVQNNKKYLNPWLEFLSNITHTYRTWWRIIVKYARLWLGGLNLDKWLIIWTLHIYVIQFILCMICRAQYWEILRNTYSVQCKHS